MSEDSKDRHRGFGEFVEDTVGFGAAEIRLTADLFRRPRAVMDAYDAQGSTAGGLYPRPLRYWLTINGLYLLFMALAGTFERSMRVGSGGRDEGMELFARWADKSSEEFQGDLEQWMSLVALPCYALFIGGALFLLFRKWSPGDDRQDFRQTFTFLNAWTLWTLPIGVFATLFADEQMMLWLMLPVYVVGIPVFYILFGAGRWWRTKRGAVLKGVVLVVVAALAMIPYSLVAALISILGAVFLP